MKTYLNLPFYLRLLPICMLSICVLDCALTKEKAALSREFTTHIPQNEESKHRVLRNFYVEIYVEKRPMCLDCVQNTRCACFLRRVCYFTQEFITRNHLLKAKSERDLCLDVLVD